MIHLADISWAQMLLIEVGALLQVVAICAYVKEAAENRGLIEHGEEKAAEEEEQMEPESPVMQHQAAPTQETEHGENLSMATKTGRLMRTAKVKFVQSFKFREPDSNQHFSGN